MFTNIKTALLSFIHPLIARLYDMSVESELAAGVADVESALKSAVAEAEKVVAKVEAVIEPVASAAPSTITVTDPAVLSPVAVVAAAAPVASSTDTILTKVKDLFTLADREITSFDTFAALAKKSVTGDVDSVLVKLKAVLDYGGIKTDVWDEVVAIAKL